MPNSMTFTQEGNTIVVKLENQDPVGALQVKFLFTAYVFGIGKAQAAGRAAEMSAFQNCPKPNEFRMVMLDFSLPLCNILAGEGPIALIPLNRIRRQWGGMKVDTEFTSIYDPHGEPLECKVQEGMIVF